MAPKQIKRTCIYMTTEMNVCKMKKREKKKSKSEKCCSNSVKKKKCTHNDIHLCGFAAGTVHTVYYDLLYIFLRINCIR